MSPGYFLCLPYTFLCLSILQMPFALCLRRFLLGMMWILAWYDVDSTWYGADFNMVRCGFLLGMLCTLRVFIFFLFKVCSNFLFFFYMNLFQLYGVLICGGKARMNSIKSKTLIIENRLIVSASTHTHTYTCASN